MLSSISVGLLLALRLLCCCSIVVKYELSYDTFQPDYNRIYRVASQLKNGEGTSYSEGMPFPAYNALRAQFPDVTTCALFQKYNNQVAVVTMNNAASSLNKKFIEENGISFSDLNFFSVFKYKWLAGNAQKLNNINTVVLTKQIAEKYFGTW